MLLPVLSDEGEVLIGPCEPVQHARQARTLDDFPIEPRGDDRFGGGGGFVQTGPQPVPGDLSGVHHGRSAIFNV